MKVAEADEAYDLDNEEPQEVTFNSFALENAVRRNMSIWRSHGMTGERRKYSTSDDELEDDEDCDEEEKEEDDNVAVASAAKAANEDEDDEWCCIEPSTTTAAATGIYTQLGRIAPVHATPPIATHYSISAVCLPLLSVTLVLPAYSFDRFTCHLAG